MSAAGAGLGDRLREALARAGECVSERECELDGVTIGVQLEPRSSDELARSLEVLTQQGLGALLRCGGSRLGLGNAPSRADVVLDLRQLAGIDAFEKEDGVVHVGAATPLSTLRAECAEHGWEVPLEAASEAASVGGAIATAQVGPRALGFGRVRDCVLGLEVVLASGERTRCGGRVVKNVTGYDLQKLYTGSLGTLGVITRAWLRLRPTPEQVRVLACELDGNCEVLLARGLAMARRPAARVAALHWQPDAARARALVELAGDEASVTADVAWLQREHGAVEAPADAVEELRALQSDARDGLRVRLAALPSRCAGLADAVRAAGAEVIAHPGLGLVYARVQSEERSAPLLAAADAALGQIPANMLIEQCPLGLKRERDVFGDFGPELRIMRELKRRFDPAGTLNPGRFAGRL